MSDGVSAFAAYSKSKQTAIAKTKNTVRKQDNGVRKPNSTGAKSPRPKPTDQTTLNHIDSYINHKTSSKARNNLYIKNNKIEKNKVKDFGTEMDSSDEAECCGECDTTNPTGSDYTDESDEGVDESCGDTDDGSSNESDDGSSEVESDDESNVGSDEGSYDESDENSSSCSSNNYTEYTLNTDHAETGSSDSESECNSEEQSEHNESSNASNNMELLDSSNSTNGYNEDINDTNGSNVNMSGDTIQSPIVNARKRHTIACDDNNNVAKMARMAQQVTKASGTTKPASQPVKSCPLLSKADRERLSCPLPKKQASQVVKSYPLQPKTKQAEQPTRGQEVKSCPLPKKSEEKAPKARKSTEINGIHADQKRGQEFRIVRPIPEKNPKNMGDVHKRNSIEEGKHMLIWVLNPITPQEFFTDSWERKFCLVRRQTPNYFNHLISFKLIDEMLVRNHLEFTTNIDITSYKKGQRKTLNPEGRAMPPAVWGFYGEGCSVRILNPSTYLAPLRYLCTTMQEYFHCLVGANVYLTPPNSQGFAPHFDDIEAFVLQVEGRKRWRLYSPTRKQDQLARESSSNFTQEELGPVLFDKVLYPGDVLYFPRGTVHQAITEKNHHSLHITLSVYQKQAYADLFEKLGPISLERAIMDNVELRRGLPLNIWQTMGIVHGEKTTSARQALAKSIQDMFLKYLVPSIKQIDAAVDQLAKRYQHEALPPSIRPDEILRTVFGSRTLTDKVGQCLCDYNLTEHTKVRLLRANILRLVAEKKNLRIYFYVDNALEYCKYESNFMEIEPCEGVVVEHLVKAYPDYISVGDLPLQHIERRIEVATALWERGLLMTEQPFKSDVAPTDDSTDPYLPC